MEWLTNTHNPNDMNARFYVARRFDETPKTAWERHLEWLKDKIIGDPRATDWYTVEQLKAMGMVGIYRKEQK